MGTRNLTAVMIDGEYKIAQYGQWDGYPEGQGITTLEFARKLQDKEYRADFEDKLRNCRFLTEQEHEVLRKEYTDGSGWMDMEQAERYNKDHPELTRNTGAEILTLVKNSAPGVALYNNISFAADSLFCEYAWVIDLDKNTFEGYVGFNKKPLDETDRFYFLRDFEENGYKGVKLVKAWNLDDLPDDDSFFKAFVEKELSIEDIINACEELDWGVNYNGEKYFDIFTASPAGEDLSFTITADTPEKFIEEVKSYAASFDIDEHIEMWIEARNNGVGGVPSTRELVKDAEDIDKMLQELATKLAELEE